MEPLGVGEETPSHYSTVQVARAQYCIRDRSKQLGTVSHYWGSSLFPFFSSMCQSVCLSVCLLLLLSLLVPRCWSLFFFFFFFFFRLFLGILYRIVPVSLGFGNPMLLKVHVCGIHIIHNRKVPSKVNRKSRRKNSTSCFHTGSSSIVTGD